MEKIHKIDTTKFRFEFDYKTGILYKYYYGPTTIDDLIGSWDYGIENNLIPATVKGFILDYREASFCFSSSDREKIPDYYRQHLNIFGNLKIAIITLNPRDIIIPILVKKYDKGYQSQPFSTIEGAIYWILGGVAAN